MKNKLKMNTNSPPRNRLSLTQRATYNNAWMGQQDKASLNENYDKVIKYTNRDPMKGSAFYSNELKVFNHGNNSSIQSQSINLAGGNGDHDPLEGSEVSKSPMNYQHHNPPTSRGN